MEYLQPTVRAVVISSSIGPYHLSRLVSHLPSMVSPTQVSALRAIYGMSDKYRTVNLRPVPLFAVIDFDFFRKRGSCFNTVMNQVFIATSHSFHHHSPGINALRPVLCR